MLVNIVIFFYQQGQIEQEFVRNTLALIPLRILFMDQPKYYITLITYMFLHAGFIHLLSNLLYLWIFRNNVEDVLGHMGFIYFYLLSGIGAGLVHTFVNPASAVPTVGASGAISGVLAAYMILYPTAKVVTLVPLFIFWQVIRVPAYVFIGFWFIFQFFYGLSSLSAESTVAGVAWFAHIGGFVVGILLLPVFLFIRKLARRG
jgi:hypothetical protein